MGRRLWCGSCFQLSEPGWWFPIVLRVHCCWFWPCYFHSGKARIWGCHACSPVSSSALFSTGIPSDFYSVSSWSDPCLVRIWNSGSLPGTPAAHLAAHRCCGPCAPGVHRPPAPLQFWHLGGAIPVFGCSLLSQCPPLGAAPTTVHVTDHSFPQCLALSRGDSG